MRVMPHNRKRSGEQRWVTGETYRPVQRPSVKLATETREARCQPGNTYRIENVFVLALG